MTTEVTRYEPSELALPDRAYLESQLRAVRAFQELCRELLTAGEDYGVIPGTSKPTLLKPGAEKISKLLGLAEHYEVEEKTENWEKAMNRSRRVYLAAEILVN